MANLGTLWFGADIDLSNLKRKLQEGNREALNALKVDYDQSSYTQMVSKLKTALANERFEVKISTNVQSAVQSVKDSMTQVGKGGIGTAPLRGMAAMTNEILNQRQAIQDFNVVADMYKKKAEEMARVHGTNSRQAVEARREEALAREQARAYGRQLAQMNIDKQRASLHQREHNKAMNQASAATRQLNSDSIRLNTTLANGVHISTQLGSALSSIFAIDAARQLLGNVIEIGGQLEKQRISMGAIIGDTARANELFEQIKGLAIKSPFGVVELDQYSKQLAAYGIEQSELFNMTKRLADISAGAGQDIGRLALALGHVKSATYLTGITLRQFSMNNIPMLKMLADYYSEVEHRAVSTAEVQKRISKRQVSYEDVIEQIKRMTDEGGQFYNMQEKISESVSAKWKNLRDSIDIMYGEMAESKVGDMLKTTAESLMLLTTKWQQILPILAVAAAQFSAYRAILAAQNAAGVKLAQTYGLLATKSTQLNANRLWAMVVEKKITKQQLLNAVATRRLTVEQAREAAAIYSVTEAQLQQIATSGKVNKGLIQNALATSRFSIAQLRALATIKATGFGFQFLNARAFESSGKLTRFGKVLARIQLTAKGVGVAIAGIGKALWSLAPAMASFAVFSAIINLWQRQNDEVERAKELNDDLFNRMTEGLKNVHQMMKETKMTFTVNGKDVDVENFGKMQGEISAPKSNEVDSATMLKNIEIWENFIKEYSSAPNIMLNAAYATDENGRAVHSLAEQYDILSEKAKQVAVSVSLLGGIGNALETAINEADAGLLDDNLLKDLKDYDDQYRKHVKVINSVVAANKKAATSGLDAARGNKEFAKALKEANISADNINDQLTFLSTNQEKYTDAVKKFKEGWGRVSEYGIDAPFLTGNLRGAFDELETEFAQVAQKFKEQYNIAALTPEQKEAFGLALTQSFTDVAVKAGVTADEVKKKWMELCKTKFPEIIIDDNTVETRYKISEIKDQLDKLVGGKFLINIDAATNAFDVIETIKKGYKTAKEQIETAKPILMKIGTTVGAVALMTDQKIEELSKGNPFVKEVLMQVQEANKQVNQALKASNELGFALEDTKSKARPQADKTDKQLKQWREELKELQEFWREYEKLAKRMQDSQAVDEIKKRGLFHTLFDKNGSLLVDVREGLSAALDKLLAKTNANTTERKALQVEIKKAKFNVDEKEIEESAKMMLEELNEQIAKKAEQFNLYKTLFEKTGNVNFASAAFSNVKIWDDVSRDFERQLKEMTEESSIDYTMTDTAAKENFKNLNGAYELWKKIVDITSKNYTDALTKAANATEAMMSHQDKIAKKQQEIIELQEKNDGIDHTSEIKQIQQEIDKLKGELLSISPEFKALFKETTDLSIRQIKALYEQAKALKTLIDSNKTRDVTNENGETIGYEYDKGNGETGYISLDNYERLEKQIGKLQKKVPQLSVSFKRLWDFITGKDSDGDGKADLTFKDIAQDLHEVMAAAKQTADALSDMFDALGNEDVADDLALVGDLFGAGSNIAKGIATGNPLDVINGITSGISAIARHHDKKLDKAIKKSELRVKRLQNAYKNLEWEIAHQLTAITKTQSKEMLNNLKKQERELESQLANERDKKKSDEGKVIDLEQNIEEAKQQIKTFYEDLSKERYGIDIDSWASDLSSAIVDAFAAGEDAADAFDKKVADMMKSVIGNIIKIQVIKPAMDELSDFLFGENGIAKTNSAGGVEITPQEAINLARELVNLKGEVEKGKNVYDVIATALKDMGIDISDKDKSSSISNTIKGITEQTAELLASYVNAIRADVSVNRQLLTTSLPTITYDINRISVLSETQVTLQQQIATNTQRNAESAVMIYELLRRVEIGGGALHVK